MRNTILFTTAFLASLSAIPARAQTPVRSETVTASGLDLQTQAGRARFQRRLAAAIETVCGSYAGASDVEQRAIGRCRSAARDGIETQLAARETRANRTSLVTASTR